MRVIRTDEDAHEAAAASGRVMVVNLRMTAFGVGARRAVLPLAESSSE